MIDCEDVVLSKNDNIEDIVRESFFCGVRTICPINKIVFCIKFFLDNVISTPLSFKVISSFVFYAEFLHFQKYGRPITDSQYISSGGFFRFGFPFDSFFKQESFFYRLNKKLISDSSFHFMSISDVECLERAVNEYNECQKSDEEPFQFFKNHFNFIFIKETLTLIPFSYSIKEDEKGFEDLLNNYSFNNDSFKYIKMYHVKYEDIASPEVLEELREANKVGLILRL